VHETAPPAGSPVRFGPQVVLTKEEVFGACQALADAGRALVRSGGDAEADTLCSLFALLEERLVAVRPDPGPRTSGPGAHPPPTGGRVGGGSRGGGDVVP
jgi:hypothetical protein